MSMHTYQIEIRGVQNPYITKEGLIKFCDKYENKYPEEVNDIRNIMKGVSEANDEDIEYEFYSSSVYEDRDLFDYITSIFTSENRVNIDFFNIDEYDNWYIGIGKAHPWDCTPEERNLTADKFDDMLKDFFDILFDDEYEVDDYTVEYYG